MLSSSESKETEIYQFLHFRAEEGIFWVWLTQLAITGGRNERKQEREREKPRINQENTNYLNWHKCVQIILSRYRDFDNAFDL